MSHDSRNRRDCAPSSPFGRGWIPASRDIGLPGDELCKGGTRHRGSAGSARPEPVEGPLFAELEQDCAAVLRQAQDERGLAQAGSAVHPAAFTPDRQVRFLDALAAGGNVRAACARVGVSAETAYRARRRDAVFAAGWAGALVLAREHAEAVLADRALNGVEEAVFYHGEEVARRRRFDGRLLLAHLARLDRRCEAHEGALAAERFDEILAVLAGAEVDPDMLDAAERFDADADRIEGLGASREGWQAAREHDALRAAELAMLTGEDEWDEVGVDPVLLAGEEALAQAAAEWDAHCARAFATVDALCGRDGADWPLETKSWPEGAGETAGRLLARDCVNPVNLAVAKRSLRRGLAGVNDARTLRGASRVPRIRSKERCMNRFSILAPAVLGATLLAIPAHADTVVFTATLDGASEPAGGDPKASGTFRASVETSTGDVCYTLITKNLAPAMAAHVHEGAAGANGSPVINIDVTGDDEYCLAAQTELLQAMAANPGNYYVNVHTKDFPAGAIRGQLVGPAVAPAAAAPVPAPAPAVEAAPAAPATEAAPAAVPAG